MQLGSGPMTQQGRPCLVYCSPDRLHNRAPDFACGMWSYMCIFAELYLGFTPSTSWACGGIISSMVQTLGPLPEQWKGSYGVSERSLDMWYDPNTKPWSQTSLAAMIGRVHPECGPVELHNVLSVLTRGFN